MKKTLPAAVTAVLAVAVLGFGAAVEESKQPEGKSFLEMLKESSSLHYQLATGKYDEVLLTLP